MTTKPDFYDPQTGFLRPLNRFSDAKTGFSGSKTVFSKLETGFSDPYTGFLRSGKQVLSIPKPVVYDTETGFLRSKNRFFTTTKLTFYDPQAGFFTTPNLFVTAITPIFLIQKPVYPDPGTGFIRFLRTHNRFLQTQIRFFPNP